MLWKNKLSLSLSLCGLLAIVMRAEFMGCARIFALWVQRGGRAKWHRRPLRCPLLTLPLAPPMDGIRDLTNGPTDADE